MTDRKEPSGPQQQPLTPEQIAARKREIFNTYHPQLQELLASQIDPLAEGLEGLHGTINDAADAQGVLDGMQNTRDTVRALELQAVNTLAQLDQAGTSENDAAIAEITGRITQALERLHQAQRALEQRAQEVAAQAAPAPAQQPAPAAAQPQPGGVDLGRDASAADLIAAVGADFGLDVPGGDAHAAARADAGGDAPDAVQPAADNAKVIEVRQAHELPALVDNVLRNKMEIDLDVVTIPPYTTYGYDSFRFAEIARPLEQLLNNELDKVGRYCVEHINRLRDEIEVLESDLPDHEEGSPRHTQLEQQIAFLRIQLNTLERGVVVIQQFLETGIADDLNAVVYANPNTKPPAYRKSAEFTGTENRNKLVFAIHELRNQLARRLQDVVLLMNTDEEYVKKNGELNFAQQARPGAEQAPAGEPAPRQERQEYGERAHEAWADPVVERLHALLERFTPEGFSTEALARARDRKYARDLAVALGLDVANVVETVGREMDRDTLRDDAELLLELLDRFAPEGYTQVLFAYVNRQIDAMVVREFEKSNELNKLSTENRAAALASLRERATDALAEVARVLVMRQAMAFLSQHYMRVARSVETDTLHRNLEELLGNPDMPTFSFEMGKARLNAEDFTARARQDEIEDFLHEQSNWPLTLEGACEAIIWAEERMGALELPDSALGRFNAELQRALREVATEVAREGKVEGVKVHDAATLLNALENASKQAGERATAMKKHEIISGDWRGGLRSLCLELAGALGMDTTTMLSYWRSQKGVKGTKKFVLQVLGMAAPLRNQYVDIPFRKSKAEVDAHTALNTRINGKMGDTGDKMEPGIFAKEGMTQREMAQRYVDRNPKSSEASEATAPADGQPTAPLYTSESSKDVSDHIGWSRDAIDGKCKKWAKDKVKDEGVHEGKIEKPSTAGEKLHNLNVQIEAFLNETWEGWKGSAAGFEVRLKTASMPEPGGGPQGMLDEIATHEMFIKIVMHDLKVLATILSRYASRPEAAGEGRSEVEQINQWIRQVKNEEIPAITAAIQRWEEWVSSVEREGKKPEEQIPNYEARKSEIEQYGDIVKRFESLYFKHADLTDYVTLLDALVNEADRHVKAYEYEVQAFIAKRLGAVGKRLPGMAGNVMGWGAIVGFGGAAYLPFLAPAFLGGWAVEAAFKGLKNVIPSFHVLGTDVGGVLRLGCGAAAWTADKLNGTPFIEGWWQGSRRHMFEVLQQDERSLPDMFDVSLGGEMRQRDEQLRTLPSVEEFRDTLAIAQQAGDVEDGREWQLGEPPANAPEARRIGPDTDENGNNDEGNA